MPRPRLHFALAVAGLLAVATWLRFWALELGLPHRLARPDETPILLRTVEAAQGHLDFDWGAYPNAYLYLHSLWGQIVLALQYGLGFAESADYVRAYEVDHERVYLIGRALTAISGVAVVGVVVAMARRCFDEMTAWGAGAWVAVCFLMVRDSHAIKPDMLTALFATLAVAAAVPLARQPTLRRGAVAGLAVGAACAAKYSGLIAAVPVCVAAWLGVPRDVSLVRRILPKELLLAGVVAAVFFLSTSPFVFSNPASLAMIQAGLQVLFPGAYEAPAAATASIALEGPDAPAWAARFGGLGTFVYHAVFSLRHGVGWLPTLLAVPALGWGLLQREPLPRLAAVFFVAWIAVVSLSPVMLSRYLTPALPALALVEVGLLAACLRRLAPARFEAAFVLALAVLLAETAVDAWSFDRLASREDTRNRATQWLAENAAPGSRIGIAGTRFLPWGAPDVPEGMVSGRLAPSLLLDPSRLDFVVTHDHVLYWSSVDPAWMARSRRWLELVADFDPAAGGHGEAVFEDNDAFYIPIAGFSAVTAPGPRVRIYRVIRPGTRARGRSGRR